MAKPDFNIVTSKAAAGEGVPSLGSRETNVARLGRGFVDPPWKRKTNFAATVDSI
jgi:hypothetical protein